MSLYIRATTRCIAANKNGLKQTTTAIVQRRSNNGNVMTTTTKRQMGGGGKPGEIYVSPYHYWFGEAMGTFCWLWIFYRARQDLDVVLGYRHPWEHKH